MADLIKARVLKGFRDFTPGLEIERRLLCETIETRCRYFGFVPIDTPALEYTEILLGKGGGETEKQIYRFTDHGGRDVALRFDLTVPFARFMACHKPELSLPFKRYHLAKVWRGENTQRGRYREFMQCDFDIVGADNAAADFEILLLMRDCLRKMGVGDVVIRLNHRGLFNRFLDSLGLRAQSTEILRTVDKLSKIGREASAKALAELTSVDQADIILDYIEPKADWETTLSAMTAAAGGAGPDTERLYTLRRFMEDAGVSDVYRLDPSITRGLDYYTGVVFETFLNDLPGIGSVCSGGRYNDLASLYSTERLPGVGASIGLDRLIAALEDLNRSNRPTSFALIGIACQDEALGGRYQVLAEKLRAVGIACDVFSEARKLTQQFILAEKSGLKWVAILSDDDSNFQNIRLREIATRTDYTKLNFEGLVSLVNKAKN